MIISIRCASSCNSRPGYWLLFIKSKNSRNLTKVETNEVYGTYDLTVEMSDYIMVEDTNDYYRG